MMLELHVLGTVGLRRPDGAPIRSVLNGSKRLALLAYLALARPRGLHRRDALLALFWPEADQKHARSSLRNMLHALRRALGRGVVIGRGDEEIGLADDTVWCDAIAFEEALAAGQPEEALELYRGDLLDGFHFPGASAAFEHWLDGERLRLRRQAAEAAWDLAERDQTAGHGPGAAHWARRAAALCPFEEAPARRLIALLDSIGDRGGALRAYDELAEWLEREFEAEPSRETRELAEAIRAREEAQPRWEPAQSAPNDAQPVAPPLVAVEPINGTSTSPELPSRAAGAFRWRRRTRSVAAAAVVLFLAAAGGLLAVHNRSGGFGRPVIAVGEIRAFGPADGGTAGALSDMLATNLARAPGIRVISAQRIYEIQAQLQRGAGDASITRAALRAGAGEVLEGMLHDRPGEPLRLDLRRVDLRTGVVRQAFRVEGRDAFALIDRATAQLLTDFDLPAPLPGIAQVSTASPVAYRFYEEGVRAYYDGDNRAAQRLLSAALADDSAFAMAAYYRALSNEDIDDLAFRRDLAHATRAAPRASDRERLIIQTAWAREMDEPRQLALADTLATRYPAEPDGHLFLAEALLWSGDFNGALPHLRQVVAMDSLSLQGEQPRCRACDALRAMVTAYLHADSLGAAERTARRWVTLQPASARAWHTLASALEYQERYDEALVARSRAAALRSDNPRDPVYPVVLALRAGDFQRADRLLDELHRPGESLVQQNVLWYRALSLLYQRRFAEALDAAQRYRRMVAAAEMPAQRAGWEAVLEAQVLREMGRGQEAAALWQRIAARVYEPESASRTARQRAWALTHAATAAAASADTARLRTLADTVQMLGLRSAYGRDRRLHHYVRGLLHMTSGDTATAAGEFRRAVFSLTHGYAPLNRELGRALLALGRPTEAIEALRPALQGPLDGNNLYANRSDLHALLAQAYREAGLPDSATRHERWVERAQTGAALVIR